MVIHSTPIDLGMTTMNYTLEIDALSSHGSAFMSLGPARRGGLFKVCSQVKFSGFLVFSTFSVPGSSGETVHNMFCGPLVHWRHRRGRQNFCLQKSRMPLAGLVYFLYILLLSQRPGNFFFKTGVTLKLQCRVLRTSQPYVTPPKIGGYHNIVIYAGKYGHSHINGPTQQFMKVRD